MQEVALGDFSLVLGRILLVHVRDAAVIDAIANTSMPPGST